MQIFDTHCHYNLPPFVSEWQTTWQKAQAGGVVYSTVVGVDLDTSHCAIELAREEPHFQAVIGCHPGHYQEVIEAQIADVQTQPDQSLDLSKIEKSLLQLIEVEKADLQAMLSTSSGTAAVKAIGETGLDYFRLPNGEVGELTQRTQKAALVMHLQLAKQANIPVVLHVRDTSESAYWDVLDILKEQSWTGEYILHCVSGPIAYVMQAVGQGAYLSMAGNVTYKNAERLRELVKFAPITQLLLETDAPFLPPQPYRGQNCEPWMIHDTAAFVEKMLQLDLAQIYQNSLTVFQLSGKYA